MPSGVVHAIRARALTYPLFARLSAGLANESARGRFARAALWSLFGNAIARGIAQVGTLVAARLLGPKGFGELGVLQSTLGLFGVFAGMGLGLTATKYVAAHRIGDPDRAGRIIGLSLVTSIVAGFTLSMALVVLAPWISTRVLASPTLVRDLRLSTGLLLLGAVSGVQVGTLVGTENFKIVAVISTIRGVLSALLLVVGVYYWGLTGAIGGLLAVEMICVIVNQVTLVRVCSRFGIRIRIAGIGADLSTLWTFTLPALLASTATMPALWFARVLLVNRPNGYAEAGVFEAANRWSLLILFVPIAVASIQLPILTNLFTAGDLKGFRQIYRANLVLTLAACAVPASVLVLFSGPMMGLYGGGYHSGSKVLSVLALATPMVAFNTSLGQVLVSVGSVWSRFGYDLLLAGVLVASALLFIPRAGALGMAIATALAYSAASLGLGIHVLLLHRRAR